MTAPVRDLARLAAQRRLEDRAVVERICDGYLCPRCSWPRLDGCWLCTCQPSPQARREAA